MTQEGLLLCVVKVEAQPEVIGRTKCASVQKCCELAGRVAVTRYKSVAVRVEVGRRRRRRRRRCRFGCRHVRRRRVVRCLPRLLLLVSSGWFSSHDCRVGGCATGRTFDATRQGN